MGARFAKARLSGQPGRLVCWGVAYGRRAVGLAHGRGGRRLGVGRERKRLRPRRVRDDGVVRPYGGKVRVIRLRRVCVRITNHGRYPF